MTAAAHAASIAPTPFSSLAVRRVDDLLALPASDLERRYERAAVPAIDDVRGDLRGRMLAWPIAGRFTNAALRTLASLERFPWRGKSFRPFDRERGEGINRVMLDRWKLFRFETSISRSRAGDFDALQLDYDLPENPFFIRAIKDEMRLIAPRLYLGQAYLALPAGEKLVLYFGLEARA